MQRAAPPIQAPPPLDFLKAQEAQAAQALQQQARSWFWVSAFLSQAQKKRKIVSGNASAEVGSEVSELVTFADEALAAFDQRFSK